MVELEKEDNGEKNGFDDNVVSLIMKTLKVTLIIFIMNIMICGIEILDLNFFEWDFPSYPKKIRKN